MHVRLKPAVSPAPLSIPRYRHHKPSGQAVVPLSGTDLYLGPWQSSQSKVEYERRLGEWLTSGRTLPTLAGGRTVNDLILAYWRHAEQHYRKDGRPTSELPCLRSALGPLRRLYGRQPAAEFGPLALKAVRQRLVDAGLCRKTVNDYVGRIKRCFKWATENELVPSSVFHGLQAAAGLRRGRSDARESERVKPVPEAFINAIRPKVCSQVDALIEFQLLKHRRCLVPGPVRYDDQLSHQDW